MARNNFGTRAGVCLHRPGRRAGAPRLFAARPRVRSCHSRRTRHGGRAGKNRGANRRRHPATGRQRGRCRGRDRLCDGRDLSARRKYRRRRLHGDSFGRAQRGHRDRLSRDRARGDHARYLSWTRRQARHRQVAQFRARHRRARHGRGTCAGAGEIRLGPIHAGADPCKPAIELARDGFVVTDDMADTLPDMYRRMARWPNSAKTFSRVDGTPLHDGDRLDPDRPCGDAVDDRRKRRARHSTKGRSRRGWRRPSAMPAAS